MDGCKPLVTGAPDVTYEVDALRFSTLARAVEAGGLHSSTYQLNLSCFFDWNHPILYPANVLTLS